MTPHEKATELIEKYYTTLPQWVNIEDAKECAKIAVNEMIGLSETYGYSTIFLESVLTEIENY